MICAGNHESTDKPPQILAITGATLKREKKESLSSPLTDAAVTLARALHTPIQQSNSVVISSDCTTPPRSIAKLSISPGKATVLRLKKLQELRELQQFSVLTSEEFAEQKRLVP